MDERTIQRFWSKVDVRGPDDCWGWLAYRAPRGYGTITIDYYPALAHRVAYELVVGPIPEGLQIDHLCRNRSCVNPNHLEAVTGRENLLRGNTRAARNFAKTECMRGHAFDEKNTYRYVCRNGNVRRSCKVCAHDRYLARKI